MSRKPTYEELEQRIKELEAFDSELENDDMVLRRLFDLSIDMLCVADITDGCFKFINNAFEKTLGYTKEELQKEPFINFVHPDDRPSTISAVENLSKGAPVIIFDNRYRCKDGSYKWISWTSMPVADQGLTYAVARDITDRRNAEEELVEERTAKLQQEITERKHAEGALKRSVEYFQLLSDLANTFVKLSPREFGNTIENFMKRIVEFFDVDRGILIYRPEGHPSFRELYSWNREGIDPFRWDNSFSKLDYIAEKLGNGEIFSFSNINDLPSKAKAEKEYFLSKGSKSVIDLPLIIESRFLGAL